LKRPGEALGLSSRGGRRDGGLMNVNLTQRAAKELARRGGIATIDYVPAIA